MSMVFSSSKKTNCLTAFDENQLKLYVHLSQIFSLWFVPFHVSSVTLTTVLNLTTDSTRRDDPTSVEKTLYYIVKQEDLYQTSEFIKFIFPHVGSCLVLIWQLIAAFFCILGALLLWPILWLEENGYLPSRIARGGNLSYNIDNKIPEIRSR